MSSVGQVVGGLIGGAIGFFIGGPAGALKGASLGMSVGGYLDPPKGPNVQGPRLTDLSSQSGSYGIGIPRIYGSMATYGNIFWLENNKLKEVVTKKKQKSGGKGGGQKTTTTTYTYFATFAVGLCDGPITGIRRIWIGSKLFYDAKSNDLAALVESNKRAAEFTLYLGTNTQMPNSRMQAEHGANCPAYRGLAYIVFNDFALAGYGNSMMGVQVKVEVVKNTSSVVRTDLPSLSWYSDVPNDSSFTGQCVSIDEYSCTFRAPNWNAYYPADSSMMVFRVFHNSNTPTVRRIYCPGTGVPCHYISDVQEDFIYGSRQIFSAGQFDSIGHMQRRNNIYVGISQAPTDTTIFINKSTDPTGTRSKLVHTDYRQMAFDGTHLIVIGVGGSAPLLKYDTDFNLVATGTAVIPAGGGPNESYKFFQYSNGGFYFWYHGAGNQTLYKLNDDLNGWTVIATGLYLAYYSVYACFTVIGDILIHACATPYNSVPPNAMHRTFFNLKTMTVAYETLGNIVSNETLKSKTLSAGDIDVTSLTQNVGGFRITNVGSLRNSIDPLQGAYPFDVYQQGYKIKYKARGGSSVKTISYTDLGASEGVQEGVVSLREQREMTLQLPKVVAVKFFDVEREYDQGEQSVERINALSVNKISIELPMSMTPTEALRVGDVLLYLYWLERSDFSFTLPPSYIDLEPTDVITIVDQNTNSTEFRLSEVNYLSDGRVDCKAKLNKATAYTSVATGESGLATGVSVELTTQMYALLMDLPCVTSDFNIPAFVIAAIGYSPSWVGGVVYRSRDQEQTWDSLQGFSYATTIGSADVAIGAWNSTLVDYRNILTYNPLDGDALTSITYAQLMDHVNVFAYGAHGRWEIIAAQNCDLQANGSYKLSNLLRGRAGTEHNTANHAIGDYIVLLDSYPPLVSVESASIGVSYLYRAVTVGLPLDEAVSTAFTYSAANLECLSPVYLNGNRHPTTNDWTLTWIRRTRINGDWRDLVDASLGETTEAYDVEIYTTSGYTTLKRTISVTTATATYTSAQQVTDFGSNQATLYLKIYQKSSVVGQGVPLTTSITR